MSVERVTVTCAICGKEGTVSKSTINSAKSRNRKTFYPHKECLYKRRHQVFGNSTDDY